MPLQIRVTFSEVTMTRVVSVESAASAASASVSSIASSASLPRKHVRGLSSKTSKSRSMDSLETVGQENAEDDFSDSDTEVKWDLEDQRSSVVEYV